MRPNKYGAKKTQIDGIWFDSKAEALHYLLLKDRQRKGEITGLRLQPEYVLVVSGLKVGSITLDFGFFENGQYVVDDRKGVKPRDWPLRSKLFMALNPDIELRVNGVAAKTPKPPKARAA